MANLGKKNGVYLARFRYQGKEYKRSLKTTDRKNAEAAMHRVEDTLYRLAIGLIHIPTDIDPGDFIVKDCHVGIGVFVGDGVSTGRWANGFFKESRDALNSF